LKTKKLSFAKSQDIEANCTFGSKNLYAKLFFLLNGRYPATLPHPGGVRVSELCFITYRYRTTLSFPPSAVGRRRSLVRCCQLKTSPPPAVSASSDSSLGTTVAAAELLPFSPSTKSSSGNRRQAGRYFTRVRVCVCMLKKQKHVKVRAQKSSEIVLKYSKEWYTESGCGRQCFGSESAWIRIKFPSWILILLRTADPDPDPDPAASN
jgi:hypothetical protein